MSDAVVERTTVCGWVAEQFESASKAVGHWVTTTPADKLDWKPKAEGCPGEGRTIYDQIHECAQVNRRFAVILSGGTPGPWEEEAKYTSGEEAAADLQSSASEIAKVIRELGDDMLTREFTTARGSMTGNSMISIALGNMYYHGGQINQIQLMLGDTEFHFPGA
jgi:hypothetical protein